MTRRCSICDDLIDIGTECGVCSCPDDHIVVEMILAIQWYHTYIRMGNRQSWANREARRILHLGKRRDLTVADINRLVGIWMSSLDQRRERFSESKERDIIQAHVTNDHDNSTTGNIRDEVL